MDTPPEGITDQEMPTSVVVETARVRLHASKPKKWVDLVFTKDKTYIQGPKKNVEKALRRMKRGMPA